MQPAASPHGYPEVLVEALLDSFALARRRRPLLVGLSGTQASGKSTLAGQLARAARRRGHETLVLALDDYYLGRHERHELARRVHPLLATRGVPGTHHIAALRDTLRACRAGRAQGLALPRFDKGRDSRLPPSRWRRVARAPALVILEGWCVGVPPQGARALRAAVNRLERVDDADGRWRRHVEDCLHRDYLPGVAPARSPGAAGRALVRGRGALARRGRAAIARPGAPRAMSTAAIRRFIAHYERLTRHALQVLPGIADVTVQLDARRKVQQVRWSAPTVGAAAFAPRPASKRVRDRRHPRGGEFH